ncbi:MAG: DNA primase [Bacteroidetes bacterium]|nr:DNA primase [Bacteroidota bacterium]
MKFTDQFIASVQDASDILDVVSERVQMKKKGSNYWGNCPFHNEKTPSFSVNPAKRIFKCFGCGKGGSVFNFIMEYDHVSFHDAVKILAEKARIELPRSEKEQSEAFSAEDSLFEVNRWAAKQFFDNLKSESGQPARAYLEKRGISSDSIVRFGIGYANSGWDDLKSSAYRDQVKTEYLEQLGLVIRSDNGSLYDRFRDRVMFPIMDPVGRVIGFGGRILQQAVDFAKYMNSPESSVYNKSRVLYGLFQAREEIRKKDEVILVEGYLDVISLHQNGVKNAVATSGTALTPDQIRLIKRYTQKNFIFLYDGDNAGLKAMERSIELLFDEGLFPQIVMLPDGHDPDSFIQANGEKGFLDFLRENRKSFIEFTIDYAGVRGEGDNILNRQVIISRLTDLIARFPDPVGREIMIQEVSRTTRVAQSTLDADLAGKLKSSRQIPQQNFRPEVKPENPVPDAAKPQVQRVKLSSAELDLLKIISDYTREIVHFLTFFIEPHHFLNETARGVYEKAVQLSGQAEFWEFSQLRELCNDGEKELLDRVSFEKYSISPKWKDLGFDRESVDMKKWVQDAIIRLRLQFIEAEVLAIRELLKMETDSDKVLALMVRNKELLTETQRLQSGSLFSEN